MATLLKKFRPNFSNIINNLKKSDMSKIQLAITIDCISSKDDKDEECLMHSTSDNIETMINDEGNEVTEELFKIIS